MFQLRLFVWSLPLFVVMSIPLLAADSPAIGVLKDQGLTRSGRFFVIEAERPVLEKWSEVKILVTEYMASVERKNEADTASQEEARLDEHRSDLQRQLDELNQNINEQGFQQQGNNQFRGGQGGGFGQGGNGFGQGANGFGQGGMSQQLIAQRNMLRMELNEVQSTLKEVKSQGVKEAERKAMSEETKKRLEGAKASLSQMRKAVDEVTSKYDALKANSRVKSAMQTLEKEKLGSLKIGPSTAFANMVKTLEKAERMVLAKKATTTVSRKKAKLRK